MKTFYRNRGWASYSDGRYGMDLRLPGPRPPRPSLEELRAGLESGHPAPVQECLARLTGPLTEAQESVLLDVLAGTDEPRIEMVIAGALPRGPTERSSEALEVRFDRAMANLEVLGKPPFTFTMAAGYARLISERGRLDAAHRLLDRAETMSDQQLEAVMSQLDWFLPAELWPEEILARAESIDMARARRTVMNTLVKRGDERGHRMLARAIQTWDGLRYDEVDPLTALQHVKDERLQRKLAKRAYRRAGATHRQLELALIPTIPTAWRERLIRSCIGAESPVYRYLAAGLMRLLPARSARRLARLALEAEPEELVRNVLVSYVGGPSASSS